MINGCALDSCFRFRSTCQGQRISPLARQFGCPRTPLSRIDRAGLLLSQPGLCALCHAKPCSDLAVCLDHAGLIMVNGTQSQTNGETRPRGTRSKPRRPCKPRPKPGTPLGTIDRRPPGPEPERTPLRGHRPQVPSQASDDLKPTTSVLTATTLTYAIRAGITAGAGTRLVL